MTREQKKTRVCALLLLLLEYGRQREYDSVCRLDGDSCIHCSVYNWILTRKCAIRTMCVFGRSGTYIYANGSSNFVILSGILSHSHTLIIRRTHQRSYTQLDDCIFFGGIEIHIRFNRVIANNFFISIKSMLILYKRMLPLFFSMYVYININSSFDFSLSRSLFNSFTLLLCSLSVWHCWWTLICMFNGVRVWTGWIIRFSKRQMVTADYPRQRHTYQTNVL